MGQNKCYVSRYRVPVSRISVVFGDKPLCAVKEILKEISENVCVAFIGR